MSQSFFTLVEDRIRQVEALMRSEALQYHPDLQSVLAYLLSSGGKRIRPVVTLLSGDMLGADNEKLMNLAAAVELLHTATLVHDDLIDGAMLRRGIPTLNTRWSPAATVLAGDYIFARAAGFAAATQKVQLMTVFAETLATIVSGEITQLFTSRGKACRDDYYKRIYAKTASLFKASTYCAALVSPVDDAVVAAMDSFGYEIGMAFQIVDDILDFTGEQTRVGKPVASDLRQGLVTLPAIYYAEAHPEDADMQQVLNGDYRDGVGMDRLVSAIRASGAIREAMNEAREFIDRGLAAIADLPDNTEHRALEELAFYIVDREI
ncbi:MAG TPA: heptaprenyl diphosphate synthase [Chloroflexi bacterium]|nr:heptaprenyl diphosphate synthase [Chloroflexota bacterium]HBY09130.1 heptaprenyl diphosphate synthase [Chloroflexota bacterium]